MFHDVAPVSRRLMAGLDVHPEARLHIAVHEIRDLGFEDRHYCEPHRHTCMEVNLLLSSSELVFRITLENEEYRVEAPATIYIPPYLLHSANVLEGSGFFVAILGNPDYKASVVTNNSPDT